VTGHLAPRRPLRYCHGAVPARWRMTTPLAESHEIRRVRRPSGTPSRPLSTSYAGSRRGAAACGPLSGHRLSDAAAGAGAAPLSATHAILSIRPARGSVTLPAHLLHPKNLKTADSQCGFTVMAFVVVGTAAELPHAVKRGKLLSPF
jgi:hypothetical protein